MVRRDAEHRRTQAAERIERDDGAVRRDLGREPVDQVNLRRDRPDRCPAGLFFTASMMNSVDPLRSAAWTTSSVHSGCAMTLPSGYFFRKASICATLKRVWTEQCPFHSSSFASMRLLAASDRRRPRADPTRPSDRAARPSSRRCCVRDAGRAASSIFSPRSQAHFITAAALVDVQTTPPWRADERLHLGRRVDVGDGDDRRDVDAHVRELAPGDLELIARRPCRPSSSRRRDPGG